MPTLRVAFRAFAAAAVLATGGPLAAQPTDATFDFYVSGIRIGVATFATTQDGSDYRATSRIEAAGILGAIASFYYDATVTGRVTDAGKVQPQTFRADSNSPRAKRHTEIDWRGGDPVRVSVEPPRKDEPDPSTQGGTVDPVSAAVAFLRDAPADEVCGAALDVYDGSRRSRLTVGAPSRAGDAITCAGTYARIEGEAHTLSNAREFPFVIVFRTTPDGLAQLARVETPTSFGRAVLERR